MTPNKPQYLETVRRGLEAAGPSSVPQMPYGGDFRPYSSHSVHNQTAHNPFATQQSSYVPHDAGMGKKRMMQDLNALKHEYLAKGGEDPNFIKKLSNLENFLEYGKKID